MEVRSGEPPIADGVADVLRYIFGGPFLVDWGARGHPFGEQVTVYRCTVTCARCTRALCMLELTSNAIEDSICPRAMLLSSVLDRVELAMRRGCGGGCAWPVQG